MTTTTNTRMNLIQEIAYKVGLGWSSELRGSGVAYRSIASAAEGFGYEAGCDEYHWFVEGALQGFGLCGGGL